MAKQRFSLGLNNSSAAVSSIRKKEVQDFFNYSILPLEEVRPSKYNDFDMSLIDEIKDSIREYGLFDPFLVCPIDDDPDGYKYEIIGGEQRYWAIDALTKEGDPRFKGFIPCNILKEDIPQLDRQIILKESNLKRRNLSPADLAKHIADLDALYREKNEIDGTNKSITKQISENTGLKERQVQRYTAIGKKLIPELKELFDHAKISIEKAAQFAAMDEDTQQMISSLLETNQKVSKEEIERLKNETQKKESEFNFKLKQLEETIESLNKKNSDLENALFNNEAEKDSLIIKIKKELESNNTSKVQEYEEQLEQLKFESEKLKAEKEKIQKRLLDSDKQTNDLKLQLENSKKDNISLSEDDILKIRIETELQNLGKEIEGKLLNFYKESISYQKKFGHSFEESDKLIEKFKSILKKQ